MVKNYFTRAILAIKILTITGFIVSSPFVLMEGLGLIALVPLIIFFLSFRDFRKAVMSGTALASNNYWVYFISAILAGAGSAFGFFMLWQLSHGIDSPQTPFAPFIIMAAVGCPLITIWVISVASSWQQSVKKKRALRPH